MSDNPALIEPGIYDGVPEAVYHGDSYPGPALSTSIIKTLLNESPLHAFYKHPALCEQIEEEKAFKFDLGSAAHALLLEGRNAIEVIRAPDFKTNAARDQRDAARAAGRYPLLEKDEARVLAMVDKAKIILREYKFGPDRKGINNLAEEGKPERTVIWMEDGLYCKARLDWMANDNAFILDYKTTAMSVNPLHIGRHITNMSYEVQDSFYRRGIRTLRNIEIPFYFFFQETDPPHDGCVIELPPAFAGMGDEKVQFGIDLWKKCLANDWWPGYTREIVSPDIPGYETVNWDYQKEMLAGMLL